MSQGEVKIILRDWMTASTQMMKLSAIRAIPEQIAAIWNANIPGLKMTPRWVEKALYGRILPKKGS